jgi:hypothetical protein
MVASVAFLVYRCRQQGRVGASGGAKGEPRLSKQGLVGGRTSATASALEAIAGDGGIDAYRIAYTNPVCFDGAWSGRRGP